MSPQLRRLVDQQLVEAGVEELYESGPCGFLIMNPAGVIVRANKTFLQWTGHPAEAVVGRRLQSFFTVPGKIFYDTHFAPLLTMQNFVRELAFDIQRADGSLLPALLNSTLKRDPQGEPEMIVTAIFDATDRRQYEQELLKARRKAELAMRAKADLLAMLSHDIRTPASAISNSAQLLGAMESLPNQQRPLQILRSASQSLINLLNDILDFSRLESGSVTLDERSVSLREWLRELLMVQAQPGEEKGLRIIAEIDDAAPEKVICDDVKIGQVLGNMISNAVKFTDAGEVRLSVRLLEANKDEAKFRFMVSDTGIGIPSDRLPFIFDDFTQASTATSRRYGGSGLGLAICKRLIRLYDSEINVASQLGVGSTFSFDLRLEIPISGE